MTIGIGRALLDTPLEVRKATKRRVQHVEGVGYSEPSAGVADARGVALEGREGSRVHTDGTLLEDVNDILDRLAREVERQGMVYVNDLNARPLVTPGYYVLEDGPFELEGGAPHVRPWNARLWRSRRPWQRFEAEDGDARHLGATADTDASEEAKLVYTPSATPAKVVKLGSSLLLYLKLDDILETRFSSLDDDAGEAVNAAGGAGIITRGAQKFVSTITEFWQRVTFKVTGLAGSPIATVRIETNSGGEPSGVLAHANLEKTGVVLQEGENNVTFSAGAQIAAGTYWLVVTATQGSYSQRGTTRGSADQAKVFKDGAWALAAIENFYFRVVGDGDDVLIDSSGLGNHATIKSGVLTQGLGKIGYGVEFNGTSGYLEVTDHPTLDITKAITIELLARPDVVTGIRGLVTKSGAYVLSFNGSVVVWSTNLASISTASGIVTASAWNHVVATYDGASMRIYVDGVLKKEQAQTGSLASNANNVLIGADAGPALFFDGNIDEVRIYNRALTAAEVKWRYDNTKAGTRPVTDYRAPLDDAFDTALYGGGTHKWLLNARGVTTATARARLRAFDKDGNEVGTGSLVTLSPADTWKLFDLGSSTRSDERFFTVEIDDPTNVNPVWLDYVDVVPA